MKNYTELMKNLTMLSQLGLSLLMPLLLCLFFCYILTKYLFIGYWVYLPGFFFGLGGSFMTAYKVYLAIMKKNEKEKKKPAAANRHH